MRRLNCTLVEDEAVGGIEDISVRCWAGGNRDNNGSSRRMQIITNKSNSGSYNLTISVANNTIQEVGCSVVVYTFLFEWEIHGVWPISVLIDSGEPRAYT